MSETVSPPPAIVVAPFAVISIKSLRIEILPDLNYSYSKAP
jgi:hypothetical protein